MLLPYWQKPVPSRCRFFHRPQGAHTSENDCERACVTWNSYPFMDTQGHLSHARIDWKGEKYMRTAEHERKRKVVEYEIIYTDKSLPEDRKSFLDGQCIKALRGMGNMPEGVESVRIVNRA